MSNIQPSIARLEFGFPRNGSCGKTSRERIASWIVSIASIMDQARKKSGAVKSNNKKGAFGAVWWVAYALSNDPEC
jgi:hypothetical protein